MMDSGDNSKIKVKVDPDIATLIPEFLKRRVLDVTEIFAAAEAKDFERLRWGESESQLQRERSPLLLSLAP